MAPADAPEPWQLCLFAPGEERAGGDPPGRPQTVCAENTAPADSREQTLHRRLDLALGGRLRRLTLTGNRSRILSSRPAADDTGDGGDGMDVRLQRCFLDAPDAVIRAVAWLVADRGPRRRRGPRALARRRARAAVRQHFARHAPPPPRRRRPRLEPRGAHFDLEAIRQRLNRRWFGGELTAAITWGRGAAGCGARRRGIRLGSYSHDADLIRIHPALDRPGVPLYVVESIVHHELLHALLPPVVEGGRRRIHTPEFRRRERSFEHHRRAERWLAKNLDRLLRS